MEDLSKIEKRKQTNLKMFKIIGIVFGSLILLGIISRLGSNDNPASKESTEVQKVVDNTIPGANPVDIYLNLESKGFKIQKQLGGSEKGCFWYCDKSESGFDYNVTIASMAPGEIEQVKISVNINGSDPDKKIIAIKPFLKYVSTLPYEGSDTNKVTNWIEENFNNNKASIVIGGAKFTMNVSKFMRLVYIEKA